MSDLPDIAREVERIRPPAEPPSEAPDELARQEEQDAGFMADLSPQKRNIHLYERTIASLERRCFILERERIDIGELHARNQKTLDAMSSKQAALKQAYADSRATNGLAALLMVLGGTSVSVAGAISNPNWKPMLLWTGIASFICGFLFSSQVLLRNSPDRF